MHIFDIESPLMLFLGKLADLMILNFLALLCCVPIVTAGASLTALHYMTLKIARDEETYIVKGFFRSFKENFKQSTVIWLMFLFMAVVLVIDYFLINQSGGQVGTLARVCIWIVGFLEIFTFMFVFPLQAKFANTIIKTIKNAFIISILQFPKTILMIVVWLIPWALVLFSFNLVPVMLMFGLSLPSFVSAKLYNKFFKKLEDQVREALGEEPVVDEDEHIFSDAPLIDESGIGQNDQ